MAASSLGWWLTRMTLTSGQPLAGETPPSWNGNSVKIVTFHKFICFHHISLPSELSDTNTGIKRFSVVRLRNIAPSLNAHVNLTPEFHSQSVCFVAAQVPPSTSASLSVTCAFPRAPGSRQPTNSSCDQQLPLGDGHVIGYPREEGLK